MKPINSAADEFRKFEREMDEKRKLDRGATILAFIVTIVLFPVSWFLWGAFIRHFCVK